MRFFNLWILLFVPLFVKGQYNLNIKLNHPFKSEKDEVRGQVLIFEFFKLFVKK